MIVLGVWGGPLRYKRPEKSARIPKESTVQEAWDILTSPVQYDEELIKIPEHRPWYVAGKDRRFIQGLLVGLGSGLMVAALVVSVIDGAPQPPAPGPTQGQTASNEPENPAPTPTGGEPATGEQPNTGNPSTPANPAGEEPAGESSTPPAPATPGAEPTKVTLTIEPGSSSQEIAAVVMEAGLVATEQEFLDMVTELGVETGLKAGTFTIPAGATVEEVVTVLTQ